MRCYKVLLLSTVLCVTAVIMCLDRSAHAAEDTISAGIDTYFEGMEALGNGDLDTAARELKRALRTFQREEFDKGQFMTHLALAQVYIQKAQYREALRELEDAKTITDRTKYIRDETLVLLRMGELELTRSNYEKAESVLRKGLAKARSIEAKSLGASLSTLLAETALYRGELATAARLLKEAAAVHRKTGNELQLVRTLLPAACLARLEDDYDRSAAMLKEILDLTNRPGRELLHHTALLEMGRTAVKQHRFPDAQHLLTQSRDYFVEAGDERLAAYAETFLAEVEALHIKGNYKEASDRLSATAKTLRRFEADAALVDNLKIRGEIEARKGQLRSAAKTLREAIETARKRKLNPRECVLQALITRVETERGRLISARDHAERASTLTAKLKTPGMQADASFAEGLIKQALSRDEESVALFDTAAAGYASLGHETLRAKTIVHRGLSFQELGYLGLAEADLKETKKSPAAGRSFDLKVLVALLKSRLLKADGRLEESLKELSEAAPLAEKLPGGSLRGELLAEQARVEELMRRLLKAASTWKTAEEIFTKRSAPGKVLECRLHRANIALDRDEIRTAETLARKNLRVMLEPGSPDRILKIRLVHASAPAIPERRKLAQRFRNYESYDFDQDTGGKKRSKDVFWEDIHKGGPEREEGPDSDFFDAQLSALRARIALYSRDWRDAEKHIQSALETAEKLKHEQSVHEFTDLQARIHCAQGEHVKALADLKNAGITRGPLFHHVQAAALAAQGEHDRSEKEYHRAVQNALKQELERGLLTVPPRETRQRESLLEDSVDMLLAAAEAGPSEDAARKAWTIAQSLKMRRLYNLYAGIGVHSLPGLPDAVQKDLRSLRHDLRNALNRERAPGLAKRAQETDGRAPGLSSEKIVRQIHRLLDKTESDHQRLVQFLKAVPPRIEDVESRLGDGELYISFLVTEKKVHGLAIGKNFYKAYSSAASPEEVEKKTGSVLRTAGSSRRFRVSKTLHELWGDLFGPVADEIRVAENLVIEPDGCLAGFPFELLVPGEWPRSWKEQQSAPLLMDDTLIMRTTSAFRFVAGRTENKKSSGFQVAVFANPRLPDDKSAGETTFETEYLASRTDKALNGYLSSPMEKESDYGKNLSDALGDSATLYSADEATKANFARAVKEPALNIHVACPILLPEATAGRLGQPFFLFSATDGQTEAAFCSTEELLSMPCSADLIALQGLCPAERLPGRALFLLLESLGLMGMKHVLCPLWNVGSRDGAATERFMTAFYSALKNGTVVAGAKKSAGQNMLDEDQKNPDRSAPATYVLY